MKKLSDDGNIEDDSCTKSGITGGKQARERSHSSTPLIRNKFGDVIGRKNLKQTTLSALSGPKANKNDFIEIKNDKKQAFLRRKSQPMSPGTPRQRLNTISSFFRKVVKEEQSGRKEGGRCCSCSDLTSGGQDGRQTADLVGAQLRDCSVQ